MASPRAYAGLASLAVCGLVALALGGIPSPTIAAAEEAGLAGPVLTVVFTGETNGHLTPCGCSKPMVGGVPRRGGYIRGLEKQSALVKVENGDLTQAGGRQDELKAETLVEMLDTLGYEAINLGEKDFRLGLAYLQSLQTRFKGSLLCANARKADGTALLGEFRVVERQVAGKKVRVAVVGLLSERFKDEVAAADPEIVLESPDAALEQLKPQLTARADVRVLLYHGPRDEAEELARQFPLFQVVVAAHEGDHPLDVKQVGAAALVSPGQDGKYVGAAVLAGPPWKASKITDTPLGPEITEDAGMLAIKAVYLDRVTSEDLVSKVPRSPTANGDTFAGSAACAGCHAPAHKVWKSTDHSFALKTLVTVKHDRDPDCVGCHVVGLDRETGFTTPEKTPELQHVGCENCHGAAAKHVKDPSVKLGKAGEASCVACHVPEHSPKFEFVRYWVHIKH
jgi:hypothetical protein